MKPPWVLTVALGILFSSGPSQGQEPKPAPTRSQAATLEKRVAELERQVSSLVKETRRLRGKLKALPKITIIPLNYADPGEIVETCTDVFKDNRNVLFEALPKMKCVAIRAGARTTKDARKLIAKLEEYARQDLTTKRVIRITEDLKVITGSIDPRPVEEALLYLQLGQAVSGAVDGVAKALK